MKDLAEKTKTPREKEVRKPGGHAEKTDSD